MAKYVIVGNVMYVYFFHAYQAGSIPIKLIIHFPFRFGKIHLCCSQPIIIVAAIKDS